MVSRSGTDPTVLPVPASLMGTAAVPSVARGVVKSMIDHAGCVDVTCLINRFPLVRL